MLTIDLDNTIHLTRGDTARLSVPLVIEDENENEIDYVMQEEDTLTLSIKKSVKDKDSLVSKTVTGKNLIHIAPEDTKPLSFAKYRYDVELKTSGGDTYTVIQDSIFEILSEVT